MPSNIPTPGLKRRTRKEKPDVLVWVARADLANLGYVPKTVRLPYRLDEPEDAPLLSAACLRLQAEMLEWSSGHRRDPNRFDGTLLSLSRRYQTDEASPFNTNMKHNTRRTDLSTLRLIEKAFGQRVLAHLKNEDFRRWYNEAKKPKDPGGPERIRWAYGIIKKLRELFAYGIMDELPGCQRAAHRPAAGPVLPAGPLVNCDAAGSRRGVCCAGAGVGADIAGARDRDPVRDGVTPAGRDRRVGAESTRRRASPTPSGSSPGSGGRSRRLLASRTRSATWMPGPAQSPRATRRRISIR